jgi:hypothetical protein
MGYETAGIAGPFHAARTADGVEAWLGRHRRPMTWPADWSVRFDPVELIGPDGETFALKESSSPLLAGWMLTTRSRSAY